MNTDPPPMLDDLLAAMADADTWSRRCRQAAEREPLLLSLGQLHRFRDQSAGDDETNAEDLNAEIAAIEHELGLG